MDFIPISINKYIKLHLKNNPSEDKNSLDKKLREALKSYKEGRKCSCGNDIWVIGSAFLGTGCFACITGESFPSGDYEIDKAIKKRTNNHLRRHINDMDPSQIAGFFDDDGYEINVGLIRKPATCLSCQHNDDPNEEFLCILMRNAHIEGQEFICHSFKNKIND